MNKLFYLIFISLIFICCNQSTDQDIKLSTIINYWYEPIYDDINGGEQIRDYYGGHVCIVLHEDGYAYLLSPNYGLLAYEWCLSEDNQIWIDEIAVDFDYISSDYFEITVTYKLIKVNGGFAYCYSEPDTWSEAPYLEDLSALKCE